MINAQMPGGGSSGGVEQALVGLLRALVVLDGAELEYTLLTGRRNVDWLADAVGGHAHLSPRPFSFYEPNPFAERSASLRSLAARCRATIVRGAQSLAGRQAVVDSSAAWLRVLKADIIHFPFQQAFDACIPSVFNPYDLQHLNFPEFFDAGSIDRREVLYRAACERADVVVVATDWTRADICRHYGLDASKVAVVPSGPSSSYFEPTGKDATSLLRRYGIEGPFILYPAKFYKHKNHLLLFEALALLRDRKKLRVNCVCTGHQGHEFPPVELWAGRLGLLDQIRFTGYVPENDVAGLYRACRFLVFPSLFEGLGIPLLEAHASGTPVCASSATCIPEVAGDAALFFDPQDPEDIARAIEWLWHDEERRQDLVRRGHERIKHFAWDRIALAHRAIYRAVAGRPIPREEAEAIRVFGNPEFGV